MKKFVMLLIMIFSFTVFYKEVNAIVCDNTNIERLTELANIIDVNYEYVDDSYDDEPSETDDDVLKIVDAYYVYVSNLSEELYIVDGSDEYYYSDVQDGILTFMHDSGSVQLFVYSDDCRNILLRTITLDLPKFNVYSYRQECTNLKELNLDFCDEWYQGYLDDKLFNQLIEPYINSGESDYTFFDKVLQFLKQYYIYGIIGLAVVCVLIVVLQIHRKRSVLE